MARLHRDAVRPAGPARISVSSPANAPAYDQAPSSPVREAWVVAGRRAGKSRIFALIAVFVATFKDWSEHLAPGERGLRLGHWRRTPAGRQHHGFHPGASQGNAAACAPDCVRGRRRDRADERHHLLGCNALAPCGALEDRGRARSSTRSGSGQDAEASSNSDAEVLAALLPAMSTIPNSLLLAAGSPYGRRGALWRTYERHFGKPGPVLVWHAPTRVMNPLLPASEIERAYAADPARASCEYDAQFRDAASNLIDADVLAGCIIASGVVERERVPGRSYFAFVDAADGRAGGDSMVLAIAHREERTAVLDLVREQKPPFSPERVVAGFSRILRSFGLHSVQADRHGRGPFAEAFQRHGISYDASAPSKANLFADLIASISSNSISLLDLPRLREQIMGLESQATAGGERRLQCRGRVMGRRCTTML